MKALTVTFVLLFSVTLFAQKKKATDPSDIPFIVAANFKTTYPTAKATWQTDFIGTGSQEPVYEATFTQNGGMMTAIYDKDGKPTKLVTGIPGSALPATIQAYMKANYPNDAIREAARIDGADKSVLYEVGITRKGMLYDIQFDKDGDFLQLVEKQ